VSAAVPGGAGALDKGPAAQAARAAADAASETAQPTDRAVLEFSVVGASHVERAACPTLAFEVEAAEATGRRIYTIALSTMVEIEPSKRRYDDAERAALLELFGEPERWASTTSSIRWGQADVLVPSFTGSTRFQLPLACTYDLEVAATGYLRGLAGGEAPLRFHFNGTVFYDDGGRMQLAQVPWECTARYAMPVETWTRMIDAHYPFRSWVALDRDTVERLRELKARRALPSIDATVASLLEGRENGRE
jgi:uncharacterized protein DUF6084